MSFHPNHQKQNSTILKGNLSYNNNFAKFDNTKLLDSSGDKQKFWAVAAFIFAIAITFLCALIAQISPVISGFVVLIVWSIFAFALKNVFTERKVKKRANKINTYLEQQAPGSYSIAEIQNVCNIKMTGNEKKQVFNVINQMPQYDASITTNTIVKRL